MKAIVLLLTLASALAWGAVASAQFGSGTPGGYFGGGGLYGGGGSTPGFPNSSPSYGSPSFGSGSNSLFHGFTYSPYNYSSPSYGLLSPSFGGTSSSLGFGTASSLRFTVPTYSAPTYAAPAYWERLPSAADSILSSGLSYGGRSHSRGAALRSGGFLSRAHGMSFYATGFGYSPTWRNHDRVRH